MLIINTYLSREICKFFCLLLTVVLGVYLIVDFFQKLDDFFEAGLPISRALVYFALKIPFIVAQVLPVCLLLAGDHRLRVDEQETTSSRPCAAAV